jgi:HK97 family phage prohead protease
MESQTIEKNVPFTFPAEILKQSEENGEFHIVGYAATSDFDLQGEIISDEALKESSLDLLKNSTVLLNHDAKQPIGKVTKAEFDEHGLLIDALISKTEPEIIQKIKEGVLNKFSIRGQVLERDREYMEEHDRMVNVIRRMTLVEVSLVSVPANPEAKAIGWYISKALEESDGKENPSGASDPKGGDPMPKDKKDEGKDLKKGGDNPPEDKDKLKKQDDPAPPAKEPDPPAPNPPAPDPEPKPAPAPPAPQNPEETKKGLADVLKAQLEPVFSKLAQIIDMEGDAAEIAKDIWINLKSIIGEPDASAPAAKGVSKSLSKEHLEKLISDEVNKQVDSVIKTFPTLRKGVIQQENDDEDVRKAFESLPPEHKLRVALAMRQS